jgi:hypothetical protein
MKPEPAKFSKENPCSKFELWQCFRSRRGFAAVQVNAAEAVIGVNAPKYLRRKGYLVRENRADKDVYVLTEEGKEWLLKGFRSYLIRYPEMRERAKFLPEGY